MENTTVPRPCPVAGAGVHSWILSAANSLRNRGYAEAVTEDYLRNATAQCGRRVPQREIDDAIRKAFDSSWTPTRTYQSHARFDYKPDRLKSLAAKGPKVDAAWLAARSPVAPINNGPFMLKHLYDEWDVVHIFDDMKSSKPRYSPCVIEELNAYMSPTLTDTAPRGVWFLCNPTDGGWRMNPRTGRESCRSQESVIRFPFAVLESDNAPADIWLSALVQIPFPIAAIYTSGGRSIHALWKVDASRKEDWDKAVAPFKRPLKVLGADVAALSAVRLTRLPGCMRGDTGRMQELLYLNPKPEPTPLTDLNERRDS